jgi:hypothetical protein
MDVRSHGLIDVTADDDARVTKRLSLSEVATLLQGAPATLRAVVDGLPARIIDWHPTSERWCVKQIVGHLIEEDRRDFVGRIRSMLEHDEPTLEVNDQDAIARQRNDCERDVDELLREFAILRAASVSFVSQLSDTHLLRAGNHAIGRLRVVDLLHEWVYHDAHHLRQILANVQSALWDDLGALQQFYRT